MKHRILYLFLVVPVAALLFFLYMSFFNSAYDHPGKSVYVTRCAGCHGDDGKGIQRLVPPIVNTDYAVQHFRDMPCMIRNGMNGKMEVNGKIYDQPMYPLTLSAVEIANLMNYVAREFLQNSDLNTTTDSVEVLLQNCK